MLPLRRARAAVLEGNRIVWSPPMRLLRCLCTPTQPSRCCWMGRRAPRPVNFESYRIGMGSCEAVLVLTGDVVVAVLRRFAVARAARAATSHMGPGHGQGHQNSPPHGLFWFFLCFCFPFSVFVGFPFCVKHACRVRSALTRSRTQRRSPPPRRCRWTLHPRPDGPRSHRPSPPGRCTRRRCRRGPCT